MNEWISDTGYRTCKGRAPGLHWLFLPGTWPLLQLQETFPSCFLAWFLNFQRFSGHIQHPKAWGPRAFISNKPLSRSLALTSVSCPNVQTRQRRKRWKQAYLLVSCQLLECHEFCSLSLRHQLRFWPKKAKVAGPKGRESGKTSCCSEVFRSSRIGDSGRHTRYQKGRWRGCSPFSPHFYKSTNFITEMLKTL